MITSSSFPSVFLHFGVFLVLALCFFSANTVASDEAFSGVSVNDDVKGKDGDTGTAVTHDDKYEEEKFFKPIFKKPFFKKPLFKKPFPPKIPIWKKPLPTKVPIIEKPFIKKPILLHPIPKVKKPFLKKPFPIVKKPFPPKV